MNLGLRNTKEDEMDKPKNRRIKGSAPVAASGVGALVAFTWNGLMPGYPMDAIVAAAVAPIIGEAVKWMLAWLPDPYES